MNKPYYTYRAYLKKRFGKRALRVPVHAGFSCPNRDGTLSTSGCTFCDNRSFSPAALDSSSVVSQLEARMKRAAGSFEIFIAYLQPFTNTYGTVEELKSIYEPILQLPGIVGLAVGTRPDCLADDVCDYLANVSRRTYLTVEVGLQSASDDVLRLNNRGHTVADFESAVTRLGQRNIETVAHSMIGLPNETREDVINTAKLVARIPVHGVKIHQLMIIKGTCMEEWYGKGTVKALTLADYAELAGEFITYLRPEQCIHRIMADSKPAYGLIAPAWSADKLKSTEYIRRYLCENHLWQGKNYT